VTRALAEKLTDRLRALDLELSREHPDAADDVARELAACHFGLGVRMLMECGWSIEDVVGLAEHVAHGVAGDLPVQN